MDLNQLNSVLAGLPHPLLVVDSENRIRIANDAARELLGSEPAERNYVAVIRQPGALDCIENALRHRRRSEGRFMRAGASTETTYRMVAIPLDRARSGLSGVIVSFEDISHVEEAEQMRRDFVANVSHELRSPLTALAGFIETLRGAARNDEAARDRFLTIMEREANRMNRLVSDLLSLTKVEVNERVRPRDLVDVIALIRSTIAALRPLAESAGAEIDLLAECDTATVAGDPDQLTQVISNLIENGLKYGASGGVVRVEARIVQHFAGFRGPALRIDVIDRGEGIDPVHIPRLTERFYRVDSHRSREKGGTGLGLAIVKHIINRHRGRFQIQSERGHGSTFSVILPIAETADRNARP
ncbi:ATP-binding protein [Rhodovulum sp. YNF3179]|uniref:ATP-binding protein n=1 Tax=Rhodovulum sp. YNF3179 TaxID=3425127 RepID=UPI003D32E1B1